MTMNLKISRNPIPRETALQLCTDIRTQYQGKWYTLAGMQCLGCLAASKGDLAKMCVSSRSDYRGCNLVTARYKRLANQ
jgi:hypothetical protein